MSTLPSVTDLGVVALMLNLGAQPDEIDGAMTVWMDEFPDPKDYVELIKYASESLRLTKLRMGRIVDAVESVDTADVPLVDPNATVVPTCEVCGELIVVRSDHNGRKHHEAGVPIPA